MAQYEQMNIQQLAAWTIRLFAADMVEKAQSGHPGLPMGCAEIGHELFTNWLRYNPDNPGWADWMGRTPFVLSAGHGSALLYTLLHFYTSFVSLEDCKQFRQLGSKTPGHPEYGLTPGVEVTTGPLGQGIATAVGMAIARKKLAAEFTDEQTGFCPINPLVYVLASEGDLMEGVSHEAMSLAGRLCLDNLIVIFDSNGITIDGDLDQSFCEDVRGRAQSMKWWVTDIDGHKAHELAGALNFSTSAQCHQPSLIIAKTHIGYGSPKQDSAAAHGAPLGDQALRAAKAGLWPDNAPPFFVPERVRSDDIVPTRKRRKQEVQKWSEDFDKWQHADVGRAVRLQTHWEKSASGSAADLYRDVLEVGLQEDRATRSHSHKMIQVLADKIPNLIGGSADLAASNKTDIDGGGVLSSEYTQRNIRFGVREHGMGAAANGLALTGFIPFVGTFLVFSDYMRPAMRLAAMNKLGVIYVLTHDSVLLGEDGPTHQPVEHLGSLRMIPNLEVWRPADGLETAAAWSRAIHRANNDLGPTVLSLTRQKVPNLGQSLFNSVLVLGAYPVLDHEDPELLVLASGSEVHVAVEAAKKISDRARVVSVPCLDLLQTQPEVCNALLLNFNLPMVSVEASNDPSWKALMGRDSLHIGVETFGASAPADKLAEHFRLRADDVATRIGSWLGSR